MTTKVNQDAFRKDFDRMFKVTSVLSSSKLVHTPFIVMSENGVETCFNAMELIGKYAPETEVIQQWPGQYRSDYILFTVGDVKAALEGGMSAK